MDETQPATFKVTKRAMYLAFGLVPIANASTDEIIAKYRLESVKVTTQYDIIDYIVTYVFGPIFSTKTVIIEGNAKK